MKKLKYLFRFLVLVLLIGGWAVAASALHIVWSGEKLRILSKDRLGVRDTYVNTSNWTADDVAAHPIVVKRLVATGKADLLAKSFESKTGDELVAEIEEAIARGPTTQPTPTVNDKVADGVEQAAAKVEQVADRVKSVVQ
jgi:hypothetical protein